MNKLLRGALSVPRWRYPFDKRFSTSDLSGEHRPVRSNVDRLHGRASRRRAEPDSQSYRDVARVRIARTLDMLGNCIFLASRYGHYTPKSDRLLRCREMTQWARKRTHALQHSQRDSTCSLGATMEATERKQWQMEIRQTL